MELRVVEQLVVALENGFPPSFPRSLHHMSVGLGGDSTESCLINSQSCAIGLLGLTGGLKGQRLLFFRGFGW